MCIHEYWWESEQHVHWQNIHCERTPARGINAPCLNLKLLGCSQLKHGSIVLLSSCFPYCCWGVTPGGTVRRSNMLGDGTGSNECHITSWHISGESPPSSFRASEFCSDEGGTDPEMCQLVIWTRGVWSSHTITRVTTRMTGSSIAWQILWFLGSHTDVGVLIQV